MKTPLRSLAVGLVVWPLLAACSDDDAPSASASGAPSADTTVSAAPDPALDAFHAEANAICQRRSDQGAALVADNVPDTGEEIADFVAASLVIADGSISEVRSLRPPAEHAEVVARELVDPLAAHFGTQKELTRVAFEKGSEHPEAKVLEDALRETRGQVNNYSREHSLPACIENSS